MKTYKINYDCKNCGCETSKTYNKGILAQNTVKCDNCGCMANKNIDNKTKDKDEEGDYYWPPVDKKYPPIVPLIPRDEKWPNWVGGDFPLKKIMDGGFPQPSFNDNILRDGHWVICQTPLKKGM